MEALRAEGADVAGWQYVNLADNGEIEVSAREIAEKYPGRSLLVNNAGISARDPLYSYDPEAFKRIMDLNVTAVFNGCRAVAPLMKAQGGGSIINTSSMVSLYGQPAGVGYPASKFAVNGITKSLARELGRDNIRVNAVAPGFVETEMLDHIPAEQKEGYLKAVPMGRFAAPSEVADAVCTLCQPVLSYLTGQTLVLDGGLSL